MRREAFDFTFKVVVARQQQNTFNQLLSYGAPTADEWIV